jgi:hypothetical protein
MSGPRVNLGQPPLTDSTAHSAIRDAGASQLFRTKLFTSGSGLGNGYSGTGCCSLLEDIYVTGFATATNLFGGNNFARIQDSHFINNASNIVASTGTGIHIVHNDFEGVGVTVGHVYLAQVSEVDVSGNYIETNATPPAYVVQIGDNTLPFVAGAAVPVRVTSFSKNTINCSTQTYAPAPVLIKLAQGVDIYDNLLSNCQNQFIVDNQTGSATAAINVKGFINGGPAFSATGCSGGQCGWLTNNGSATGATTGVLYDDADPISNTSLTPTTPTQIGGLNLGLAGVSLGTLGLSGNTSGRAVIQPQAVAGTPTLTLPNATGTLADGASSPLALNATTGNLTCTTCATTTNGGPVTGTAPVTVSAGGAIAISGISGIQGTDANLLSAGTVSGTGNSLCTDANGGATTVGCPTGTPALSAVTNPVASTTFTFPATNTLLFNGTAPVSVSGAGTAAGALFTVTAPVGGATTGSATTAGTGGTLAFTGGAGGSGSGGTNAIGGAGGGFTFTAGAGGASSGTAINSNGGGFSFTMGAAGTGGSGTAGTKGTFTVSGGNITFGSGSAFSLTMNGASANNAIAFQEGGVAKAFIQTSSGVLQFATGGSNGLSINTSQLLTINKTITSYNGLTTAGEGVPVIVGTATQTAQTGAIGDTTLFTVGAATTLFRFSGQVNCTTTSSAATATLNLKYTDSASTAQTVSVTDTCTTLVTTGTPHIDQTFRAKNGTAITYGVTISNTPTYDVDVVVEQLHQ